MANPIGIDGLGSSLARNAAKAQMQHVTGQRAQKYSDVPQFESLQAVSLSLSQTINSTDFYEQQILALCEYQTLLEDIGSTITDFTMAVSPSFDVGTSISRTLPSMQSAVKQLATTLVHRLNRQDAQGGFFFGGAARNQRPIDLQLLEDLKGPSGPTLKPEGLEGYFVNGTDASAQHPLRIYGGGEEICQLPLMACDMKAALQGMVDFLSLSPDTKREQVQLFFHRMEGPSNEVYRAVSQVSDQVKHFETVVQVEQKQSVHHQEVRDRILKVDPVEAAIALQESQSARTTYLNDLTTGMRLAQKFREIVASFMRS